MARIRWRWPETALGQREYMKSLRLGTENVKACKSAAGKIVHVVHFETDLNVNRVKTCGSIRKGTASSKSSDLDIVIFIDDLEGAELENQTGGVLDEVQCALDTAYPGSRDLEWYRKFGLRYNISGMKVDILIGVPNVMPKGFLDESLTEQQRAYLSASVSHLATNFMKKHGNLFKDLVRVVKDWRDSYHWKAQCKPKSYLLEVILLAACQKNKLIMNSKNRVHYTCGRYLYKQATSILIDFFALISQVQAMKRKHPVQTVEELDLFIHFETFYKLEDVPLDTPQPLFVSQRGGGRKRNAGALVLDPINPTNNLWLTLEDPIPLIERARLTLDGMESD